MARTFEFYVEKAHAAFEAGFATMAAKKEAIRALGYAYEMVREECLTVIREAAPGWFAEEQTEELRRARAEYFAAGREVEPPFELHQVRARHIAEIEAKIGKGQIVEELVALREAIKAAEVVRVVKPEKTEIVVRVERTIAEVMEARKAGYLRGIQLGEILGGLPVHANTHWVTNEFGTTFLRTFYFMAGKMTALQVIVAAYEECVRRGTIVVEKK